MGMIKDFFNRKKKIARLKKQVMASYYVASSDSNSLDFSFAGSEDLNQSLKADLTTLRNRIRYELRQNGPAEGLLRVYANACISTGPTLSVESKDKKWNELEEFKKMLEDFPLIVGAGVNLDNIHEQLRITDGP